MEFIDSSFFFSPYILITTCLLFMLRGLSQREISRSAWSVLPAGDESGGMNCSGRNYCGKLIVVLFICAAS